jgi:hypothetical protein
MCCCGVQQNIRGLASSVQEERKGFCNEMKGVGGGGAAQNSNSGSADGGSFVCPVVNVPGVLCFLYWSSEWRLMWP